VYPLLQTPALAARPFVREPSSASHDPIPTDDCARQISPGTSQAFRAKINSFRFSEKNVISFASRLIEEGRIAIVRKREAGSGGRDGIAAYLMRRRTMPMRT
jgi:hypothetical protein